jgi:rubrerythrin
MKTTYDMQEFQKATCSSCGTTFVAENAATTLCPSCSANQEHHQHSGCGCGH